MFKNWFDRKIISESALFVPALGVYIVLQSQVIGNGYRSDMKSPV